LLALKLAASNVRRERGVALRFSVVRLGTPCRDRKEMARLWQFSLRSLLAVVAVLSVPCWMLTYRDASVRFWATALLGPILGGCAGYLAASWAGVWHGVAIGTLLTMIAAFFWITLLR